MLTVRFPPLKHAGCGFTRMTRRDRGMLWAGRPGFMKHGGICSAQGPGRRYLFKRRSQHEPSPPSVPYNGGMRWMPEPLLVSERCFFPVASSSCPPMDYKYPQSPAILCAKYQSPHGTARKRGLSKADGLDVCEHLCITELEKPFS